MANDSHESSQQSQASRECQANRECQAGRDCQANPKDSSQKDNVADWIPPVDMPAPSAANQVARPEESIPAPSSDTGDVPGAGGAGAPTQAPMEQWVDEHGKYLFQYACRYVQNEETAEDLVQETFLAALSAKSQYRGDATARTWLTGILRHKICDSIRKRSRNKEVLQPSSDATLDEYFDANEHWINAIGPRSWDLSPEAAYEQQQFHSVLTGCLDKLPERLRQLFLLREIDGLSREELCNLFALTSSNVGVTLHRIRLALQRCVQVHWLETAEG